MTAYQRIFVPIEVNLKGESVVRRAQEIAAPFGATLFVVSVVDHHCGFESDHVPFMSPQALVQKTVRDMQRRLDHLLERAGASQAQGRVLPGKAHQIIPQLAATWQPDLVVLAQGAHYGLSPARGWLDQFLGGTRPWDLLTVRTRGLSVGGGKRRRWFWLAQPG